jgi:hypothetical protein
LTKPNQFISRTSSNLKNYYQRKEQLEKIGEFSNSSIFEILLQPSIPIKGDLMKKNKRVQDNLVSQTKNDTLYSLEEKEVIVGLVDSPSSHLMPKTKRKNFGRTIAHSKKESLNPKWI